MRRAFTLTATAALAATIALAAPAGASDRTPPGQLGPTGYKSLHLGQNEKDAEATKLLVDKEASGSDCTRYYLHPDEGQQNVGSGVWIDKDRGVVMISATDRTRTPEGIGLGNTLEQARTAYPKLRQDPEVDFVYTTPAPGNSEAEYALAVDTEDRLADLTLSAKDMGSCA